MSRELKFRVWSVDKNRWIKRSSHYNDRYSFGYLDEDSLTVRKESCGEFLYRCDNMTIQQFTGLLDKDNKEVYEGDIVTYTLGKDYFFVDYVIFECYGFRLASLDNKGSTPLNDLPNLKIIGNIFENPELIQI